MLNLPGVLTRRRRSPPTTSDIRPSTGAPRTPRTPSQERRQEVDLSAGGSSKVRSHLQGKVCRDDFEVLEVLGEGGFGEVKLVRCRHDDGLYAMKAVEKAVLHERRHVGDTAATLRALVERDVGVAARHWSCPFIVELLASFQTPEKLYYVFEYCPGGQLCQLLQMQPEGCFCENTARLYVAEVCLALEHLHANDTLHRDVRLENMLLAGDGHVKLADFGIAKTDFPDAGAARASHVFEFGEGMTDIFYPPEFVRGESYGKDLDCWQLGVALFAMLVGTLPGGAAGATSTIGRRWPGELPDEVSADASELCRRLLAAQRGGRLGYPEGAKQLQAHAFFTSARPDFWQAVESKSIAPPKLERDSLRQSSHSHRWARPTLPGWTAEGLLRLSNFSFTASMAFRGGREGSQSRGCSSTTAGSRGASRISSLDSVVA